MKEALETKISEYCRFMFKKIDVEMGCYVGNARCHHNSKQKVKEKKADGIAMVVMIDRGEVIAHFVNTKGKKFVENTLGYKCEDLEYFLVKILHKDETEDMDKTLGFFHRKLVDLALNPIEKIIFKFLGGRV